MFGVYHKYLTDITHRHTFLEARKSIESMVKLEKEKKEQVGTLGRGWVGRGAGGGLTEIISRHTFLEARQSIEPMVKLEKKEQVCTLREGQGRLSCGRHDPQTHIPRVEEIYRIYGQVGKRKERSALYPCLFETCVTW